MCSNLYSPGEPERMRNSPSWISKLRGCPDTGNLKNQQRFWTWIDEQAADSCHKYLSPQHLPSWIADWLFLCLRITFSWTCQSNRPSAWRRMGCTMDMQSRPVVNEMSPPSTQFIQGDRAIPPSINCNFRNSAMRSDVCSEISWIVNSDETFQEIDH